MRWIEFSKLYMRSAAVSVVTHFYFLSENWAFDFYFESEVLYSSPGPSLQYIYCSATVCQLFKFSVRFVKKIIQKFCAYAQNNQYAILFHFFIGTERFIQTFSQPLKRHFSITDAVGTNSNHNSQGPCSWGGWGGFSPPNFWKLCIKNAIKSKF